MQTTQLLAATALATAWCLSVPTVSAQERQQSQQPPSRPMPSQQAPSPSPSAPDLSDQKLDATAAAMQRVASLQQDYRQRVAAAQAPADKERITAEANDALTKAVNEQGLSVDEYASILQVARDNPEVRGKILQRIQPAGQPTDKPGR